MSTNPELIADLKSKGIEFLHRKHQCTGYHGTSKKQAERILDEGFKLDFANNNSWFGLAHYFYDNAPFSGTWFASCFAKSRFRNPQILEADLNFNLLLDLNQAHNEKLYWQLYKLAQDEDPDVDERFVGHFIGKYVASAMASDGIAWTFPLQDHDAAPPGGKVKRQRGFAVKVASAISRVRVCK